MVSPDATQRAYLSAVSGLFDRRVTVQSLTFPLSHFARHC